MSSNKAVKERLIERYGAECFIERKLSVYNDYLEKLLKDPYSYIDDIKLTDLYNKGDINRRLTSIRILEVFENTRKEIL